MVEVGDGGGWVWRWWEIGACERVSMEGSNMTGPIAKIRKSMSSSLGLVRHR